MKKRTEILRGVAAIALVYFAAWTVHVAPAADNSNLPPWTTIPAIAVCSFALWLGLFSNLDI